MNGGARHIEHSAWTTRVRAIAFKAMHESDTASPGRFITDGPDASHGQGYFVGFLPSFSSAAKYSTCGTHLQEPVTFLISRRDLALSAQHRDFHQRILLYGININIFDPGILDSPSLREGNRTQLQIALKSEVPDPTGCDHRAVCP